LIFSRPTQEQAIALAAVFQNCELVADLAHKGEADTDCLEFAMGALLNQNPDSLEELYGPTINLTIGINSMAASMGDNSSSPLSHRPEVMRYVISILYLARKMSGNKRMLSKIANGIEQASRQAQHFSVTHDNVYGNIASLYQETVSTMRLRIQVSGSGMYLQQPALAQRIRCLLFAAIRSAFLWQQLGGKRSHLMLQRKAMAKLLPSL
jgi:high frequency lysogenization protein